MRRRRRSSTRPYRQRVDDGLGSLAVLASTIVAIPILLIIDGICRRKISHLDRHRRFSELDLEILLGEANFERPGQAWRILASRDRVRWSRCVYIQRHSADRVPSPPDRSRPAV